MEVLVIYNTIQKHVLSMKKVKKCKKIRADFHSP